MTHNAKVSSENGNRDPRYKCWVSASLSWEKILYLAEGDNVLLFPKRRPEPFMNFKLCKVHHNILFIFSHQTKAKPQVDISVPLQTCSDLSLSPNKYTLLFLVLAESVLQSAFVCVHIELNRGAQLPYRVEPLWTPTCNMPLFNTSEISMSWLKALDFLC